MLTSTNTQYLNYQPLLLADIWLRVLIHYHQYYIPMILYSLLPRIDYSLITVTTNTTIIGMGYSSLQAVVEYQPQPLRLPTRTTIVDYRCWWLPTILEFLKILGNPKNVWCITKNDLYWMIWRYPPPLKKHHLDRCWITTAVLTLAHLPCPLGPRTHALRARARGAPVFEPREQM